MADEERVPEIDWGDPNEYGTALDFTFTALSDRFPDFLKLSIKTTKLGIIDLAVSHEHAMKLLVELQEIRAILGLPLPVRNPTAHASERG